METKHCSKCKRILPATLEYFYRDKCMKLGLASQCKNCNNEQRRKYYLSHKEETKLRYNKWVSTDNGREKTRSNNRKYSKSNKGKITNRRKRAKRRKMGYIELIPNPFDDNEQVDWHHIGLGAYVVAIPKDLHQLYNSRNKKNHQRLCWNIVRQIYLYDD